MSNQTAGVFVPEGSFLNRPLDFDDKNYYYQKKRTKLFLESQEGDLWHIVVDGPYIPTTTNDEGASTSKPKESWTLDEKTRVVKGGKGDTVDSQWIEKINIKE